ncbi:transcription elongation factor GreA [Paenibacillus humicola]|uniref:transcription elongation factor GreA n=1 Tax=Paenibacillus humicola TaxID=3110540 RepID=UPI00237A8902|nr:transcription elongation factor GreA [Paenibacillus humicola]
MENEQTILTPEGFKKIEDELRVLKSTGRRELAERLKVAISYGDLKENSEYHSAKEDQAFMESRIQMLERMLKNARVVDTAGMNLSEVNIGCVVTLNDIEFAEKVEYRIVSPAEADVADNKISYESPLGKELLGKKVGDTISVEAPVGTLQYELLEIKLD